MKKTTYKIIVINHGGQQTYELKNKRAKNKWLYEFLTHQERLWAWEQWKSSAYKTFNRWFRQFVKLKWKESSLQSLRVNKKLILIKKEKIIKKVGK